MAETTNKAGLATGKPSWKVAACTIASLAVPAVCELLNALVMPVDRQITATAQGAVTAFFVAVSGYYASPQGIA
jgi:hypothetical protein